MDKVNYDADGVVDLTPAQLKRAREIMLAAGTITVKEDKKPLSTSLLASEFERLTALSHAMKQKTSPLAAEMLRFALPHFEARINGQNKPDTNEE